MVRFCKVLLLLRKLNTPSQQFNGGRAYMNVIFESFCWRARLLRGIVSWLFGALWDVLLEEAPYVGSCVCVLCVLCVCVCVLLLEKSQISSRDTTGIRWTGGEVEGALSFSLRGICVQFLVSNSSRIVEKWKGRP